MFDKILKTNLPCTKNEFFSTCDQICKKKSLTENFSFCAVSYIIVWCHFGKKLNWKILFFINVFYVSTIHSGVQCFYFSKLSTKCFFLGRFLFFLFFFFDLYLIFYHWSLSLHPENIRNLFCFQGVKKQTSGFKCVKQSYLAAPHEIGNKWVFKSVVGTEHSM